MMKKIVKIFLFCLLITSSSIAFAQGIIPAINLSVSPSSPAPNNTMSASIVSSVTNLNTANIAWYIDNVLQSRGVGETRFSFTSPALGDSLTLRVTAATTDRGTVSETRTIRSGSVDLVWESDSYTPPLYRGKALYPAQGSVRIVAIPHIPNFSDSEIIYTWSDNGTILGSLSGTGRNTLDLPAILRSEGREIFVEIETPSGLTKASANLIVPVSNSFVRLYENSPVLGVLFNNAPRSPYVLPQDEVRLEAYPYFFSIIERGNLEIGWRVNGQKTEPTDGLTGLTLRRSGGSGEATVTLSAESVTHLLQRTAASLKIEF